MVSVGPAQRRLDLQSSSRCFSTSIVARSSDGGSPTKDSPDSATSSPILAEYTGPMAKTFYRLKLFSMGSLLLASTMTPFFLLAPAEGVGLVGRLGLCATALGTSGVSTAIVAWIAGPYVGRMSLRQDPQNAAKTLIEANTLTWRLRPLQTTIFEPSFIRPTSRPFASWELPLEPGAGTIALPSATQPDGQAQQRLLVAETKDLKSGRIVGKWWAEAVPGTSSKSASAESGFQQEVRCVAEGRPATHFQVHEELLGDDWRILS